ncbi:MAG: lysozyme inhibitor LprI family protein [Lentilitoribacter sp.]
MIKSFISGSCFLVFSALATPTIAQDWDCSKTGELPQQGMNFCAAQDFHKADAALNAAWSLIRKDAIKRSDGEDPLLTGQRAWLDYRDNQCEAESLFFEGGSLQPFINASCRARTTRARTEELLLMERYR